MPIVFIHGVAVRRPGDPGWEQVRHTTGGVHWDSIQAMLRQWVAPALDPVNPQQVKLHELYWGDLGASYGLGGRSLASWKGTQQGSQLSVPDAQATPRQLGEALEKHLLAHFATQHWPRAIETAWNVAHDSNLREVAQDLPRPQQWPFLVSAAEARMPHLALRERLEQPTLPTPLMTRRRENLRRTFTTMRRPIEDFVPLFLGDVLNYLNTRGTPQHPGPLMRRVLDSLNLARQSAPPGEPLVVLSHSMGGQLVYDALTSFIPADPDLHDLRVDFWCACGSQVGLFREMGQFLEQEPLPTPALAHSPHAGYFWNVWSYSDLLSFRAEGIIEGAHDTAFPFLGNVRSDHLAYLSDADFYRVLAAQVRVHSPVHSSVLPDAARPASD